MAIGTPNHLRTSLERWLALAAGNDSDDKVRALRCLQRYVHAEVAPQDGDWAGW